MYCTYWTLPVDWILIWGWHSLFYTCQSLSAGSPHFWKQIWQAVLTLPAPVSINIMQQFESNMASHTRESFLPVSPGAYVSTQLQTLSWRNSNFSGNFKSGIAKWRARSKCGQRHLPTSWADKLQAVCSGCIGMWGTNQHWFHTYVMRYHGGLPGKEENNQYCTQNDVWK